MTSCGLRSEVRSESRPAKEALDQFRGAFDTCCSMSSTCGTGWLRRCRFRPQRSQVGAMRRLNQMLLD